MDLLMIPGPVPVAERVRAVMAKPLIGHRTPEYRSILRETVDMFKWLLQTKKADTFILASSGTGAMDAAIANVVSPGDKVVNIGGGKFGERFGKITKAYGGQSIPVPIEWGKAVNFDLLKKTLEDNSEVKLVTFTHNETSTGVLHPGKDIAQMAHDYGAIVAVDCITSVGGDYVLQDEWGFDIIVTGSQKCIGIPPGLGFISVLPSAWEVIEKRSSIPAYYLNLNIMRNKWLKDQDTPFTSAVPLILALRESLKMMQEEGYKQRIQRHHRLAKMTRAGFQALGFNLFAEEGYRSNTVTSLVLPEGVTDKAFRGRLKELGVSIAGGQDHVKGKIVRVAHMNLCSEQETLATIALSELALNNIGYKVRNPGAGIAAAIEASK